MSVLVRPLHLRPRSRTIRALALGAALLAATATTAAAAVPASADTTAQGSGTYSDAGASCWGIKQAFPSSADGSYWIQTPKLVAPIKVYCDMTTSGGGWELVGRGRQGWTWSGDGQGSAYSLAATPSGTGAYSPAAFSDEQVDGLLNGTRVDSLPDGVQLRRANIVTNSFQNPQTVTLSMSNRADWSWAFGGGIQFSRIQFDGRAYGGCLCTGGAGITSGYSYNTKGESLSALKQSVQGYAFGFNYGKSATGFPNNATTAVWSNSMSAGFAIPFTQVWIRPQIANSVSYPTIPASGTTASTVSPLLDTSVQPSPWGVTGLMKGYTGEGTMQVEALQQVGSSMFVGGLFSTVRNADGSQQIQQPYLAAFDLQGNWISSFRPQLNGEVWTAVPYKGELLIGGDFTSVNGTPAAGIALLDPTSGAVDTTWNEGVSGSTARVRDLDVQGDYVYVGGSFTQLGASTGRYGHNNIGRIVSSTGTVDQTWQPGTNGAVFEVDASDAGDHVYVVGNFTQVNGQSQADQATLDSSSGQQVPGLQPWVPSTGSGAATYQQTTLETGNTVWQGGSQHILSAYNRSDYSRSTSFITKGPSGGGGDLQKLIDINGVLYASCHCSDYAYSGTYNYSSPAPTASDVTKVDYMLAVDTTTQQIQPGFDVLGLKSTNGNGVWAMGEDSNQCLWFGGDFTAAGSQWLGSFGRICSRDTTAPTAPTDLQERAGANGPSLSWTASSDDSGVAVSYEVLRNDRVIATVTGTSYTDNGGSGTYYVRAIDKTGNRSASTAGVTG